LKFEIYDLISEKSDEERNVENDCSGDDIHPDSSADGAGNSIM
jgi:hypothetical protein